MPNTEAKKIIIDGSPLRYLHTGLGQFAYYLIRELAAQPAENNFSFLVHQPSRKYLADRTSNFVDINWPRRHLPEFTQPLLFRKYALWHASSEITRFTRFSDSTRVLVTLHGLHFMDELPPAKAKAKLQEVQRLVNHAHALATVSGYTETIVRKYLDLGTRPLKIIHHGVADRTTQEVKRPQIGYDGKFIFSIGSFFERKNFHVLLPFVQQLEGYALVLAGDHRRAYGDFVKNEIHRLGLSNRVFLPGEISEPEKNWLYRNCDAFAFPSVSEGFGIPVIEAMQAGKPVFCSTLGSLPEMGGKHAYYWTNFDPVLMRDFFVEKIQLFNQKPDLARNCKLYADDFTWSKAARSYLDYYAELLQ